MFGSDAFLLARIANREPARSLDEYDLSRISPALRTLAERLIVAGHLERRAIWDEFLARGLEPMATVQGSRCRSPWSASRRWIRSQPSFPQCQSSRIRGWPDSNLA
jgi:hypothetical protein